MGGHEDACTRRGVERSARIRVQSNGRWGERGGGRSDTRRARTPASTCVSHVRATGSPAMCGRACRRRGARVRPHSSGIARVRDAHAPVPAECSSAGSGASPTSHHRVAPRGVAGMRPEVVRASLHGAGMVHAGCGGGARMGAFKRGDGATEEEGRSDTRSARAPASTCVSHVRATGSPAMWGRACRRRVVAALPHSAGTARVRGAHAPVPAERSSAGRARAADLASPRGASRGPRHAHAP